jgi:hypothetical protein
MKDLKSILNKLGVAFGLDITQMTPDEEQGTPAPNQDDVTRYQADIGCGITEAEIIEAVICGEAAGCSDESRLRVWGVIKNRARRRGKRVRRGVITADGVVGEIIKPYQFDSFSASHPCGDGDPFQTCEALKARIECLKRLCGNRPIKAVDLTDEAGNNALKKLGFDQEAERVYHFMTLSAFMRWRYICQEAKDAVKNASGGNRSWVGCVTVTCDGKTHKICSDGCHLFISDVAL